MVVNGTRVPATVSSGGTRSGSEGKTLLVWDLLGIALVGGAATWLLVVGAITGTDASPAAALVVASAAVYSGARLVSRFHPLVAPAALVGVTSALLIAAPDRFLGREPDAYPLGYANANGELLVHAAAAALLIRAAAPTRGVRVLSGAVAIVLGVLPFVFGSLAAGILGLTVLAVGFGTSKADAGRGTVVAVATLFALVLVTTIVAATLYRTGSGSATQVLESPITERRVALWQESLDLMGDAPVTGIGFGRFEQESSMARAEEDIRWVPNTFLEQGAEAGIPGLMLAALLMAWGFARLYVSRGLGHLRAIGAASWGALGIHACMDYTLHYIAIPLVAVAILGAATSDN